MTDNFNAALTIMPGKTPNVMRRCRNCNRKMPFYCSEKFRVNGNHTKLDIWLIYKCEKCDTTWKLTIKKGLHPQDIPPDIFDGFINNNKTLAWRYAFDRPLLKNNECEINYDSISYTVERMENPCGAGTSGARRLKIVSPYSFDLKLSAFIASGLGVSVGAVKKWAEQGLIATEPEYPVMKYKIKSDFILILQDVLPSNAPGLPFPFFP